MGKLFLVNALDDCSAPIFEIAAQQRCQGAKVKYQEIVTCSIHDREGVEFMIHRSEQ